jgi:hypothetical protein
MSDINRLNRNRDETLVKVPRHGALGGKIVKRYIKQIFIFLHFSSLATFHHHQ